MTHEDTALNEVADRIELQKQFILIDFSGEYRARTGDLLHAMQAL